MTEFTIRRALPEDMDYVMRLIANEGWNPGLADGQCFYAADADGFWIGELAGKPMGCVSGVRYRNSEAKDFGFIGCYIVEPEMRGHIYSAQLGRHAMAQLADCNVGIDGVLAQQEHYRHFGFELAHRNLRYMGDCRTWPVLTTTTKIVSADTLPFDQLADYDRRHFPAQRSAFLRAWLEQSEHRSLAFVEDGEIRGYGTVRKCLSGYKVGPLFAADSSIALALLLALADIVRQRECNNFGVDATHVYLDISEENAAACDLVKTLDMQFVFETARMYSAGKPAIQWQEVYGITTFELG